MMNKLEHAICFALEAHSGQTDKQGKAYFWHVLAVAQAGKNEDEQIVGALHDVLEDCSAFYKWEVRNYVTAEQFVALELLSRIKSDGTKKKDEDYYAGIRGNALAKAVKENDIGHNTSPERMGPLPENQRVYLTEKYRKARIALEVGAV